MSAQALASQLTRLPQPLQFALVGGCAAATHLAVVALLQWPLAGWSERHGRRAGRP